MMRFLAADTLSDQIYTGVVFIVTMTVLLGVVLVRCRVALSDGSRQTSRPCKTISKLGCLDNCKKNITRPCLRVLNLVQIGCQL